MPTQPSSSFIPFAIISGFFAALSSVFAKLFSDERTAICHSYISSQLNIVPEKVRRGNINIEKADVNMRV
jgi:hypothetical protein